MKHYLPAGSTAEAPYSLVVTPESAGWTYTALRVVELSGAAFTFETGEFETIVLPLSGSCTVRCDDSQFELAGRRSVFSRVTDFAYVPRDARVTVAGTGRFALAGARCTQRLVPRYVAAEDVPVELRGAGPASRQVNNFGTPTGFPYAEKLIACEVLTPSGCWSSYPPHKHDEETPTESVLEEIYYFEVAPGPAGQPGIGYQHLYGRVDVLEQVRDGDVVLVPYGWHGPSMAVPGHHLYYLNVMAGPSQERAWKICDDPSHAWIRDTWPGQAMDARLPLTSAEE